MIKKYKTNDNKPGKSRVFELPPFELGLTPEAEEEAKHITIKEIAEKEIAEMEKRDKERENKAKKEEAQITTFRDFESKSSGYWK